MSVAMGADASQAALRAFGDIRRISVVTPEMPVGAEEVRKFFSGCGFQVPAVHGLTCESPTAIVHVNAKTLRDAVREVDDPQVETILQVGTNLAFARIPPIAEFWLDKPVLAINMAIYWCGLLLVWTSENNITYRMDGFGSPLRDH